MQISQQIIKNVLIIFETTWTLSLAQMSDIEHVLINSCCSPLICSYLWSDLLRIEKWPIKTNFTLLLMDGVELWHFWRTSMTLEVVEFKRKKKSERNESLYLPRLAKSPCHACHGAQAVRQLKAELMKCVLDWGTDGRKEKVERAGEEEGEMQEMNSGSSGDLKYGVRNGLWWIWCGEGWIEWRCESGN